MSTHPIWGHLRPDTPFAAIFQGGLVPLQSIIPVVVREDGGPLCYLAPGRLLTEAQVASLAELLYEKWRPECESIEMAAAYIREDALPIRAEWFTTVGTAALRMIL